MAAARTVRFANGFSMTLAFEGNRFLGIGEVRCGRRLLRSAALPHMHRLRLTPHGDCTLWLDAGGQPSVLWAFRDGQIEFTGEAADLETGRRLDAERTLRFIGGKVYRLRSGPAPDLRCVRDR